MCPMVLLMEFSLSFDSSPCGLKYNALLLMLKGLGPAPPVKPIPSEAGPAPVKTGRLPGLSRRGKWRVGEDSSVDKVGLDEDLLIKPEAPNAAPNDRP